MIKTKKADQYTSATSKNRIRLSRLRSFSHLTVLENIGFDLPKRWPKPISSKDKLKAEEILDLFDLAHFATRLPFDLSGRKPRQVGPGARLSPQPRVIAPGRAIFSLGYFAPDYLTRGTLKAQGPLQCAGTMTTRDPEDIRCLA